MTSQLNHYILRQRQLELTARAEHARLAARAPRPRNTSDLNPGGGRTRIARAAWDGLVSDTSMPQEISK
jgi:hypothetical protein